MSKQFTLDVCGGATRLRSNNRAMIDIACGSHARKLSTWIRGAGRQWQIETRDTGQVRRTQLGAFHKPAICKRPSQPQTVPWEGTSGAGYKAVAGGRRPGESTTQASQCYCQAGIGVAFQTSWSTPVPVPGMQMVSRSFFSCRQTSLICFVCCCFRPH